VRKRGHLDLEALEILVRSSMHQAGAAALTELLHFPVPDQRTVPCPCGQRARYRGLNWVRIYLTYQAIMAASYTQGTSGF
jgi:hypothetical protein